MAHPISTKAMNEEALRALIDTLEAEIRSTWAVYADYDPCMQEWLVRKIEPWSRAKHAESMSFVHKITGAVDEMGAYTAFLRHKGQA